MSKPQDELTHAQSSSRDVPPTADSDTANITNHQGSLHNVFADTASVRRSSAQANPSDASKSNVAPRVNRRRFLQGVGSVAVGSTGLALAGCGSDDDGTLEHLLTTDNDAGKVAVSFVHGVASGDPLSDRVILWTRVTPEMSTTAKPANIEVQWQVASDAQMQNIVASGKAMTSAKHDYTVKVDATGLQANTQYYYQFRAGDVSSRIGKTKTLPVGDVSQVTLAVFSCANYPAGYFHAYADAAKRNDIDVCVHLGDYIYEYGRTTTTADGSVVPAYASANAEMLSREVEPATEIVRIEDYRRRYAQYRTDADLQELHASIPMIAVWDDHELTNDAWENGAENHQPETEGRWDARKLAAVTAYHEWMPTRNSVASEIFRRFDFGNLVSLHMLDTRVIGRDEQLDYRQFIKMDASGEAYIDAEAFNAASYDANRELLGLKQSNWLVGQMQTSTATWQMLGQQVLMARMLLPAPVILNIANPDLGLSIFEYLGLANKAKTDPQSLTDKEKQLLSQPFIPYNLDAWDGYGSARERVLTAAASLNKNLVVLAGDTHNAWSSNLTNQQGTSVGVEFATSSVTSPGFEEYVPDIPPAMFQNVLLSLIDDLKFFDSSRRGYMVITATPDACQSEWVFVSDILQATYSSEVGKTLSVKVGENKLSEV